MAVSRTVRRRPVDGVVALVAAVVAIACTLVAHTGEVPGWEQAIFHAVNGLPDQLTPLFFPLQLLGVLVVPALVAVVIVVWKRAWRAGLALLLLIPLKLFVELKVLKVLVDRERPAASICEGDLTCGNFRNVPLAGDSYPSGHAVIAGAMVVILLPYLNRAWRITVICLGIGVLVARVYLGAHNPLDVVGGAAVGVVVGCLLNLVIGVSLKDGDDADAAGDEVSARGSAA